MSARPVIGITTDFCPGERPFGFVFSSYDECIERAGGLPLHVPPLADVSLVPGILGRVDAVVIPGGEDLDPALYGETPLPTHDPVPSPRQAFDLALARALLSGEHPVLGICYGCQLLAVASGGALHQDIPSQVGRRVVHAGRHPDLPRHEIEIRPGTRLREIVGRERIEVNSGHHQAPKLPGDGLVVAATAADGVLEAIESPGERFLLGVEWHPELMGERADQRRLFEALVAAAAR